MHRSPMLDEHLTYASRTRHVSVVNLTGIARVDTIIVHLFEKVNPKQCKFFSNGKFVAAAGERQIIISCSNFDLSNCLNSILRLQIHLTARFALAFPCEGRWLGSAETDE